MKLLKAGLGIATWLMASVADAQTTAVKPASHSDSAAAKVEKKLVISGMMISRFTQSLTKGTDINGKYHTTEDAYSTSSFSVRRVRVQAKAQITPRAEAAVLLNLTDFIGNPSNKVLENAYMRYRFSNYLNLQVGQFRPYFGREDLYPEELLQALEWSNSYYAFGANGWQSFQTGATVFGKVNILNIPVSYYVGMFNGNGRNQPMDNDNSKLFPARLELAVRPNTKLGLNGGVGKDGKEKVWALNADIDHVEHFGEKWELELQSEYKKGLNNSQFDTSTEKNKRIGNYQIEGFYVLPCLKYSVNSSQVKTIEFSMRYENLNCDVKRYGSVKQTWMPVIGLKLAGDYDLRFETGLIIDRFSNLAATSKDHNATRFVCQLQARF
jgi:hypothetical protein